MSEGERRNVVELTVKPSNKRIVTWTVLVAAGLAAIGWQAMRLTRPREGVLRLATVTKLDVASRSGEISFVHPRSGQPMTIAAEHIPAECEITVDGRPATLADVRVGDTVSAGGLIYPDHTVSPRWLHVTRATSTTRPAPQAGEAGDH